MIAYYTEPKINALQLKAQCTTDKSWKHNIEGAENVAVNCIRCDASFVTLKAKKMKQYIT